LAWFAPEEFRRESHTLFVVQQSNPGSLAWFAPEEFRQELHTSSVVQQSNPGFLAWSVPEEFRQELRTSYVVQQSNLDSLAWFVRQLDLAVELGMRILLDLYHGPHQPNLHHQRKTDCSLVYARRTCAHNAELHHMAEGLVRLGMLIIYPHHESL
jgi:hypothetical protein